MSYMDVKEFVNHEIKLTRKFVEEGRDVQPVFFLLLPDGKMEVVGTRFTGALSKSVISRLMQQEAREKNAIVVAIMDSWYKTTVNPTEIVKAEREGLRNDPQRREMLMVSVFGPGIKPQVAVQRYERQPDGTIKWEPLEWTNPDHGTGRFMPDMSQEGTNQ